MNQPQIDLFLQACSPVAPLELDILYPGHEVMQRCLFHQPFVLIGRNANNDVCLPDRRVSKRHVYLQMIGGHLFYLDLGSRTGVQQQGRSRLQGWLDPGQALWIGPCAIRLPGSFCPSLPAPGCVGVDTLEQLRARQRSFPTCETNPVTHDTVHVGTWRLDRELTLVGTVPECGICLSGPTVSRYHCALLQAPAAVWALDLLGREGICVNGSRVRWVGLKDGDRLQIGAFAFQVHYENGRAVSPPESSSGRSLVRMREAAVPLTVGQSLAVYQGDSENTGSMEAVVLPVLKQFHLMQQQMFDQFHQTMLMMVQMFSSLHQDQTRQVREELDHLHAITRELHTLRAELTTSAAARPSVPPPPTQSRCSADQTGDGESVANGSAINDSRSRGDPSCGSEPATPKISEGSFPDAPATPAVPPGKSEPGPDVHAWMTERIARLEAERQTRWQKFVAAVLGR